jgi:hypothetical protein
MDFIFLPGSWVKQTLWAKLSNQGIVRFCCQLHRVEILWFNFQNLIHYLQIPALIIYKFHLPFLFIWSLHSCLCLLFKKDLPDNTPPHNSNLLFYSYFKVPSKHYFFSEVFLQFKQNPEVLCSLSLGRVLHGVLVDFLICKFISFLKVHTPAQHIDEVPLMGKTWSQICDGTYSFTSLKVFWRSWH